MNDTIEFAEAIRYEYRTGKIDLKEARKQLKPFIDRFNKKSVELAKKYNVKPQKFNINAFMR